MHENRSRFFFVSFLECPHRVWGLRRLDSFDCRAAAKNQGRRAKFNYCGNEKELHFFTREISEGRNRKNSKWDFQGWFFLVQNARERLILDNIIILLIIFKNTRRLRNLLLRRERLGVTLRDHRVHYRRGAEQTRTRGRVHARENMASRANSNIFKCRF